MQILYFYIAEHPLLKDQNINLGGKYRFHYDPKDFKFTVSLNPYYLDGFFDTHQRQDKVARVNNLTAIVGQNGTGKTSLLEFIKEHLIADVDGPRVPIILAVEEQQSIKVYHFNQITIRDNNLKDFGINLTPLIPGVDFYATNEVRHRPPVKINDFQATTFVHFSNVFDGKLEYGNRGLKDISTNYLITDDHRQESNLKHIDSNTNQLDSFFGREIERQIDFVNYFHGEDPIDFQLPEYLEVKAKIKNNLENRQFNRKDAVKVSESYLTPLLKKMEGQTYVVHPKGQNYDTRQTTINYFTQVALFNLVYDLILHTDLGKYYSVKESLELPLGKIESNEIINILMNVVNRIGSIGPSDRESVFKPYSHALDHLSSFTDLLPEYITENRTIFTSEGKRFRLLLNKERFARFYDTYKRSFVHTPYLTFSWSGISSGEKAYLNILSRFYALSDSIVKDVDERLRKNVIILIDEGDVYLHPEWQPAYCRL